MITYIEWQDCDDKTRVFSEKIKNQNLKKRLEQYGNAEMKKLIEDGQEEGVLSFYDKEEDKTFSGSWKLEQK